MANLFFTLPAPAGNGGGAGIDVSQSGREKTIQVEQAFRGTVNIQISLDNEVSWVTVASFNGQDKKVVSVAAQFMRVVRLGVPNIDPGLPSVSVSANNDGAKFAVIPAAPGMVNTEELGGFRTVTRAGIVDPVNIDVSDNGTDWTTCMTFQGAVDLQSKSFTAKFMRSSRAGQIAVGGINEGAESTVLCDDPPETVRGDTNAPGVKEEVSRCDHQHRLEYEVEDEGVLVSARPRMNFVGAGVGAIDVPGEDKTEVTIPGGLTADGAVVSRSLFIGNTVSTTSLSYVDAMSGLSIPIPIDGDYLVFFEGEGANQSGSAISGIGISVDSLTIVETESARDSQGPAADMRPVVTSVLLTGLTAGQLIRALFRKTSGAGQVSLERRHLFVIKVQ